MDVEKPESQYNKDIIDRYKNVITFLENKLDLSKYDLKDPNTTSQITSVITSIFREHPALYKEKNEKHKYKIANTIRIHLLKNYKEKLEKSPPTSD